MVRVVVVVVVAVGRSLAFSVAHWPAHKALCLASETQRLAERCCGRTCEPLSERWSTKHKSFVNELLIQTNRCAMMLSLSGQFV